MNTLRKLTPAQRTFFKTVARAAFCNPFSDIRLELDLKISEADRNLDRLEITARTIDKVNQQIARMEKTGTAKISQFSGSDREILHTAFLFEIFHEFMEDFDRHILKQTESGDKPCNVPFAQKAMLAFYRRGFSELEACRYFGFFFQLRRAFFLINQDLVGDSASMREFRCQLWNNLFTHDTKWFESYLWDRMEDFSTLLLGETGTGKGAAAAAIGRSGYIPFDDKTGRFKESFTKNFISRNLSQFPETLIESELFGHKKGAFTGAISDYKGVFAQCTPHGAIFLDEIGDLTPPVQIKLLQILQDRVFSPVGSHETFRFNGRVIAATNRPIHKMRKEGKFRDDFFYRLCSDVITVPTLRQRVAEDCSEIEVLLSSVITRIIGSEKPELASTIRNILEQNLGAGYTWPGNVRELEQAVRRIFLSGQYQGEIEEADVEAGEQIQNRIVKGEMTAQEVLFDYCKMLYDRHGTYEEVANITGLDRRTVKKYIQSCRN